MAIPNSTSRFFTVGGTLSLEAPYVVRLTDDQLLGATLSGEYCNVLAPRQTGKSSLMVRTAKRLRNKGVRTAVIDLTRIGTELNAEAWFLGLVTRFKEQLDLTVDEQAWWKARAQQGVVQRFSDFLRDVILEEIIGPVVIFVDEIDSTLGLSFTDDFFAAIRAAYNARATDSAYKRLTFVLLGVARPADLIKDRSRTPYNIGLSIDLRDFGMEEASVLLPGLEAKAGSTEQAEAILRRVLYWTGGHPYLTQKVCAEIVVASDGHWADRGIDRLVERLFLSDKARKEHNLQYVNDRIRASQDREKLLRIYRKVHSGRSVTDEEHDPVKSRLKLLGLLKSTPQGSLAVRNRIYEKAFNRHWIRAAMPKVTLTRITIAATTVVVIALALVIWMLHNQQNSDAILAQAYTDGFLNTQSPAVRISNLAGLFQLGGGFADGGRDLFFDLDANQRLEMFTDLTAPEQVGDDLQVLIKSIYAHLENTNEHTELLQAMADSLSQIKDSHPDSRILCGEIKAWLRGRAFFQSDDYQDAIASYNQAINYNSRNPATRFERALTLAATEDYKSALADLEEVHGVDENWQERVQQVVIANGGLYLALWSSQEEYPGLAALVPTPIPTPTPTPAPTQMPSPKPASTQMPSPTPTPTSTPSQPPPSSDTATAIQGASIYTAPDVNSQVLGGISQGQTVPVLGCSANGNWLYVRNAQNVEGFAYGARFAWTGNCASFPVKTPLATVPPETPVVTPGYPPLVINLWLLDGTCQEGVWSRYVFIEGKGGNGVYTYYWQGEKLAGPMTGSYSFAVSSTSGGAVVGTGKVVSGDGQVVEQGLYVQSPCP